MPAHKRGFTLVELLVVIAIIAVLSTVGLVSYSTVQKSGRMSKRIQDLKAIQTALELYYSVNKSYPTSGGSWRSECTKAGWVTVLSNDVVPSSTNFVPKYMPAFPSDPSMDPANGISCYAYRSDGNDYKVFDINVPVTEITLADLQSQPNFWDPAHPDHPNKCLNTGNDRRFAVWNSEASRCW